MPCRPCGLPGRVRSFPLLIIALSLLVVGLATPASAQSVSGRVVDPQDRPVASASVLVVAGTTVVASAQTRRDGRFGPLELPSGTYELIISAPGLGTAPRTMTLAGADVSERVVLSLRAVAESVVVSAAQVDAPLSRVTDSVTVIDRAELEARQTETVADALRLVPGYAVVSSGGRGAITSIFPRGGESDYARVMVDGIPFNSFGGGFDAAHLAATGLERIEVVRGPQSALHGSGAVGGVVQLITQHGGATRGRAELERGGWGTARSAVSAAGTLGAISWGGAADRLESDGDQRSYPDYGGRIENDDYERWNVSGGLGWSGGAARRLRIDARHARNERGFPGAYGSDPAGLYGGIDTVSRGSNRTTGLALSGSLGSVLSTRHSGRLTWFDTDDAFASRFGESESGTTRLTGRYQVDVERRLVGLSAGVEMLAEEATSTFVTGEAFRPVPVERSNTGLFVETRWGRGTRSSVSAGLRVERIARRPLEADPAPFNNRPPFDEHVVWSANPKVSAVFFVSRPNARAAGRWTKLRLSAGTGIKSPTAFEIAYTDNPRLEPERSRSIDVGVEQALAGATVLLDATWFANRYDDLIVTVGSGFRGASPYRTDNIANASARGVELGATWRGGARLRVRGAWTFLDTEVLAIDEAAGQAPAPFEVGDPLLRRAPRQGSVEVHWATDRASLFTVVNGRSAMLDLEPNFASSLYDNPGHVSTTLGGSVRLFSGVEVFGRVTNLFDRDYEDVVGYPAPGRVAFMGVRLAAGR